MLMMNDETTTIPNIIKMIISRMEYGRVVKVMWEVVKVPESLP